LRGCFWIPIVMSRVKNWHMFQNATANCLVPNSALTSQRPCFPSPADLRPVFTPSESNVSCSEAMAPLLLCKGVGATRSKVNASDAPEHALSGHHLRRCALLYVVVA